jgi:RNA polymerase sigma-70 factor, ECF subfamily
VSDDQVRRLYVAHGPAIYIRCLRLLRDPTAAEDATQEIFLKVQRQLKRPEGEAAQLRWVFRIATNHCLTVIRDRRPTVELPLTLPSGQAIEDALLVRDLAQRVIAEMPEQLALPAWLHYVDGLGLEEVAEVVGVSPRTVFTRLEAFRERARELLAREPS